jgi:hypothetical protein
VLPILVTPEFAFSAKLTLKISATWQHQPLFSRLLKIAAWNELNGDELAFVFGPQIMSHQWLLKKPEGVFWRKLRYFLKDSNTTLIQAYPPCVIPLDKSVATHLRGCQCCYKIGFHSALYQLYFMERCPLHDTPIIDGCPHCSFLLPYAITNKLKRQGFRCQNCGLPVFNLKDKLAENTVIYSRLLSWRKLLLNALPQNDWEISKVLSSQSMLSWQEACRQWNIYYGEIPQIPVVASKSLDSLWAIESMDDCSLCDVADRAFYLMRRIQRHQFSKMDKRRYNELSCMPDAWLTSLTATEISIVVFMMWRVAWEKSFAFEHYKTNLNGRMFPLTVTKWLLLSHPKIKSEELYRQYCLELCSSYQRCHWLILWMLKKGGILISKSVMRQIVTRLCIRPPSKKSH